MKMNIERMNELALFIRSAVKIPHHTVDEHAINTLLSINLFPFNMESFTHSCGTPLCVVGWTVHIFGSDSQKDEALSERKSYSDIAREILGLTHRQGCWLFYGEFSKYSWSDISTDEAADAIEFLINNPDADDEELTARSPGGSFLKVG